MNQQKIFDGASGEEIREILRGIVSHEIANRFTKLALSLGSVKRRSSKSSHSERIVKEVDALLEAASKTEKKITAVRDKLAVAGADPKSVLSGSDLTSELERLLRRFSPLRSISAFDEISEKIENASRTVLNMQRAIQFCEGLYTKRDETWEPLKPSTIIADIQSSVNPEQLGIVNFNLGRISFVGIRSHVITALSNYVDNALRHVSAGVVDPRVDVDLVHATTKRISEVIRTSDKSVRKLLKKKYSDWIVISVRNNGPSIPEEYLNVIWDYNTVLTEAGEPKSTTDDSDIATRVTGRGLGLTLAKYAAETHGGNVWVRNNSTQGVTFYFIIPRR